MQEIKKKQPQREFVRHGSKQSRVKMSKNVKNRSNMLIESNSNFNPHDILHDHLKKFIHPCSHLHGTPCKTEQ